MIQSKENKNIANIMKNKMGATVVDTKSQQSSNNLPAGDKDLKKVGVVKGKKKVIKTREYKDEKGYLNFEDYSSYEECELPPPKQTTTAST